uniref:Uncharacterized protein n=1 Tax=Glossina pallidipes TaxID=7398 RepID=A0A1A9ZYP2_GLOPL
MKVRLRRTQNHGHLVASLQNYPIDKFVTSHIFNYHDFNIFGSRQLVIENINGSIYAVRSKKQLQTNDDKRLKGTNILDNNVLHHVLSWNSIPRASSSKIKVSSAIDFKCIMFYIRKHLQAKTFSALVSTERNFIFLQITASVRIEDNSFSHDG